MMIFVFQNFKNSSEMRQNSSGEAKKWMKIVDAIQQNVFSTFYESFGWKHG